MRGKQIRLQAQVDMQNERLRISRDLHDNIGAELTLISSTLYSEKPNLPEESERFQKISAYAKNAMNQLRETVWSIRQESISLDSFCSRVNKYGREICSAANIQFQLNNKASERPIELRPAQTMNLFRVCQEAINNAVKYSEGKCVALNITYSASNINIEIVDDGKGFNIKESAKGNGLVNMRERINEIGGKFQIYSKIGQGTEVRCSEIAV
jgi:signal transduction histidine kinase